MDASPLEPSMDPRRSVLPQRSKAQAGDAATAASQSLVMSSNDEFHWCAEMDYQFPCDHSFRSNHSPRGIFENSTSEISFTSNSDSSLSPRRYKNFDIHLAQIDMENFKSEDIERISHTSFNRPMEDSTDTLRIVESMRSLNALNAATEGTGQHLHLPTEDCEALSVDSLDLSLDNEINAQLIQKCSERDKTRYKIAMIDTSVHSQMHSSTVSNSNEGDLHGQHAASPTMSNGFSGLPNGAAAALQLSLTRRPKTSESRCSNPFIASMQQSSGSRHSSADTLQSPCSLVQMFIQNKIGSNESSLLEPYANTDAYLSESLSKCDIHNHPHTHSHLQSHPFGSNTFYTRQHSQGSDPVTANFAIDEIEENMANSAGNSLNTVDSNELPLHVLDLSKKLRSMNLAGKQGRHFGSTSASSNTSYTSTTTSSSAATFDRRRTSAHSSTNPFLQMTDSKRTRTTSTQFPETFQEKGVQASFEEDESRDAPVLVYYPNYSLPDLSFLQDIFKQENSRQPVYLSPVKHEPPRMMTANSSMPPQSEVKRRGANSSSAQRKCRPKSYTDYETLLSQDFSDIKDWDSLNLLLPDDFKEFMEKNNLLGTPSTSSTHTSEQYAGANCSYPIKTTIPNSRIGPKSVRLRSHSRQQQPSTKRYSLQEAHCDPGSNFQRYYPAEVEPHQGNLMSMTRSQTMPNCRQPLQQHVPLGGNAGPQAYLPGTGPAAPCYHPHNCCHGCCHSGCHSPSFHSSQTSPSKPNFNWEMLSSSRFQKLLSFLSKLDECASDHSDSSKADTQVNTGKCIPNSITEQRTLRGGRPLGKQQSVEPKLGNASDCVRERPSVRPPTKHDVKPARPTTTTFKPTVPTRTSSVQSKATSPMSTNREVATRRTSTAPERTKIILKRPTTLKSGLSNSGIPVPKRTSSRSMIPTSAGKSGSNSTALKDNDRRSKEGHKSGANMRF